MCIPKEEEHLPHCIRIAIRILVNVDYINAYIYMRVCVCVYINTQIRDLLSLIYYKYYFKRTKTKNTYWSWGIVYNLYGQV